MGLALSLTIVFCWRAGGFIDLKDASTVIRGESVIHKFSAFGWSGPYTSGHNFHLHSSIFYICMFK